jgi:predicted nucleic acid-binding protein
MEKIYLDTSVISAYFDERIPYQRDLTRDWWERIRISFEISVSTLTLLELEAVGEPKKVEFLRLVEDIPVLELTDEVEDIANKYISAGIVPARYMGDAFHLAYATYYKIDYLVTWNYSHFANIKQRKKIRLFNTTVGLFTPEIVTPEFFVEVEK